MSKTSYDKQSERAGLRQGCSLPLGLYGIVRNAAFSEMQYLFKHLGHLQCNYMRKWPYLALETNSSKKFVDPDVHPDHPHNVILWSLFHCRYPEYFVEIH